MSFDEATFTAFYNQTAKALWAFVYRTVGNAADTDDLVSEAFCRLLLQASNRQLPEDAWRRYAFRIAGNLVIDRWRLRQREEEHTDTEPVAISPNRANTTDVVAGFERLSEHDRVLLWLAYVEGHTHKEIAQAVGVRKGSVKMLLSRARDRLRRLLATATV